MNAATEKPTDKARATPLDQLRNSQNSASSNLPDMADHPKPPSAFPQALKNLVSGSYTNIEEYKKNIQLWFETKMKSSIATYRKQVARNSFFIGLIVAIAINGDSLYIANRLWIDPPLRQAIVAQAENLDPNDDAGLEDTLTTLESLSLPLGWTPNAIPTDPWSWFLKGIGILLTALATAQGSPFWYDLLRRLISAKSDSAKPEQPAPVG